MVYLVICKSNHKIRNYKIKYNSSVLASWNKQAERERAILYGRFFRISCINIIQKINRIQVDQKGALDIIQDQSS